MCQSGGKYSYSHTVPTNGKNMHIVHWWWEIRTHVSMLTWSHGCDWVYEMEIFFQGPAWSCQSWADLVPVCPMMSWETRIISQLFGKRLPFQGWQSSSKPLSEHTFGWIISGFNTRSPEMIVNHPKITKGSDWWMMFINVGTVPPYHPKLDSVCIETYWNPCLTPTWLTGKSRTQWVFVLDLCMNFPNPWVKLKIIKNRIIWVNYNDLAATSLESWLIRKIIPKWP